MISNTITLIRTLLTVPIFILLAISGPSWMPVGLFYLAGLLDVIDGKVARARGETSPLGGWLDLAGDRLLTLAAVAGLLAARSLSTAAGAASLILVARCHVVASAGEALGGQDELIASPLEPLKIALSFAGLGLAMAPPFLPFEQTLLSEGLILAAAAVCAVTVAGYVYQTVRLLRPGGKRSSLPVPDPPR